MKDFLNLKQQLFSLRVIDETTLGSIDKDSSVRFIDSERFKVRDGFKTKLAHKHRLYNMTDLSKDGEYAFIGIPNSNKAALYLSKDRKLKAKVGMHKGEVEAVAISDNNHYLATGGTDGKSFVYMASTATVLLSLPNHRDYVSCIAFDPSNTYVATGSFDRLIHVQNIATMANAFTFSNHTAPIKRMLFVDKITLVSADKGGDVIVWDLSKRKAKVRLPKLTEEIIDLTLTSDKRFLFASTVAGNIGLYDLEKEELITARYIHDTAPVTALAVSEFSHTLYYANETGELKSFSLLKGEEELIASSEEGNYKEAYTYVEKNPLLTFSSEYKALEDNWEVHLAKAKELLAGGFKDEAYNILAPFNKIPRKGSVVKKLMADFTEFEKFRTSLKNEQYPLSYSLANKYPVYKETKEYQALEALWEKVFAQAKRSILEKSGEDRAKALLMKFRGSSEKARLINDLFNERKVYVLFMHKLVKKEYPFVLNLAKKYPFIKELKEYKELVRWADAKYIQINHHYTNHDYLEAIKLAQEIKDFPDFKEELSQLLQHSEVFLEFEQFIHNGDMNSIYRYLDKYDFLQELPNLHKIDTRWNEIETVVQKPLALGDLHAVLEVLQEYKTIKYRREAVINLIKGTYVRQIELALKKEEDTSKIKRAIATMYQIFGKDNILEFLNSRLSERTSDFVDFETLSAGGTEMVHIQNLPMDILELHD